MRIILIGGGAREHALAWKLKQSSLTDELVCLGGNPGMAGLGDCPPMANDDIDGIVRFCQDYKPDLVVPGSEVPLVLGLIDRLSAHRIPAFGPTGAAAQLEGSKGFTKDLCTTMGIPTAAYHRVRDAEQAKELVRKIGVPVVLKADGLAAGKGVIIAHELAGALTAVDQLMDGHAELVIEEFMEGPEISFFALSDGVGAVPLTSARDYKRAFAGDQGLNTGGMGVYSPVREADERLIGQLMDRFIEPTLHGLGKQGSVYKGILYAGLMLTADGPKLVEYNARFGDPECQVMMPRLTSDLVELMLASVHGELANRTVNWSDQVALGVVVSDAEYPTGFSGGGEIKGLSELAAQPGTLVFQAGTEMKDGVLVSKSGRVLTVVQTGASIAAIRPTLQAALTKHLSQNPNLRWREDIGYHEG
jgi:phosphoribosylamine---glycine ligase